MAKQIDREESKRKMADLYRQLVDMHGAEVDPDYRRVLGMLLSVVTEELTGIPSEVQVVLE